MAQSAGYKAAAARSGPNVSKGAAVKYDGGKLVGTSNNAQIRATQEAQYGQSASGVQGYANPDYYIKDVRDSQGNLISTGGTLTVDSSGNIIDSAGGNYGNMEATSAWNNYYADNPTQAIQEAESQRAQEAQLSSLEQRKAEQAQYAAERAAQEYSGATADMYGDMAREAATGGTTRPNVEPQSTFTRQTTKDGKRFADSPTSDNYQNVYREESIFGSQITEVDRGTTDIQKMERMLIDAKINNTERELDSLNQQIALSDQKLKNITSIEKAKNAQKGSSGVAGGITEPYLESSNPEYASENERMKNLKAQQLQMKKVFDAQTEEKRQKGSLTAAFDRNVQGISRDPAPMDSDPVVADYGMREQGSTPFLTSITDNEALKADNPNSPFAGLTDATPGALEKSQRDDVDGITAWGGWTPHKGDGRLPWGQVRAAFSAGTDSAPSLTIPGTEGAKRDELNRIFYESIDTRQDGLFAASDGIPKYVNIGQGGQVIETYTDDLGKDATRVVRTFDPVGGEERDTLQAIYARQFEDRLMNREQKEYFNALTGGQVSISDALTKPRTAQSYINLDTGVRSTERGVGDGGVGDGAVGAGNMDVWLAEQGYSGREEMQSVNWRLPREGEASRTAVQVPEGATYTPEFDKIWNDTFNPTPKQGPQAPIPLTDEQKQLLSDQLDPTIDGLLIDDPSTPIDESKGDGTFTVSYSQGGYATPYTMTGVGIPPTQIGSISVGRSDLKSNIYKLIESGMSPDSISYDPAPRTPPVITEQPVKFGNIQGVPSMLGGTIALSQLSNLSDNISTDEKERTDIYGNVVLMDDPDTPEDESAAYKRGNTGNWFADQAVGFVSGGSSWLENIGFTAQDVPDMIAGKEMGSIKDTSLDMIIRTYTDPFESDTYKEFERKSGKQVIDEITGETRLEGFDAVSVPLAFMGTSDYSALSKVAADKNIKLFQENPGYYLGSTLSEAAGFLLPVSKSAYVVPVVAAGLKTARAFGFTSTISRVTQGTTAIGTTAQGLALTPKATTTSQKIVFELGKFFEKRAAPEIQKIEAELSGNISAEVSKTISVRAANITEKTGLQGSDAMKFATDGEIDLGSRAAESIKYTGRMSSDEARIVKEAADLKGATQGIQGSRAVDNPEQYINVARSETLTATRGQGFVMYGSTKPLVTNIPKTITGDIAEAPFKQSGIVGKGWFNLRVIPTGSQVLQLNRLADMTATVVRSDDKAVPTGWKQAVDDFDYLTNKNVVKETEKLDEVATFGMTQSEKTAAGIVDVSVRETEKLFWTVSKEKEGLYSAVGWMKRVNPETGVREAVTVVDNVFIERNVASFAAGGMRKYLKFMEKGGRGLDQEAKEKYAATFFKEGGGKNQNVWIKAVDGEYFKKGIRGLFNFEGGEDGLRAIQNFPGAITIPKVGRTGYITKYTVKMTDSQVSSLTGKSIDTSFNSRVFSQYVVGRAVMTEQTIIRTGLEPVEGTYRRVSELVDGVETVKIAPVKPGFDNQLVQPIVYKILPNTMATATKMKGWADNLITGSKSASSTPDDAVKTIFDKPGDSLTFLDKNSLRLLEDVIQMEQIAMLTDDGGFRIKPSLVKQIVSEKGLADDITFDRNYQDMLNVEKMQIKKSIDTAEDGTMYSNIPRSEIPAMAELSLLRRLQFSKSPTVGADTWTYIKPKDGGKEKRDIFNLAEKLTKTADNKRFYDDLLYQLDNKKSTLSPMSEDVLTDSIQVAKAAQMKANAALGTVEKQVVLQTMQLARKDNKLLPAATISQLKSKVSKSGTVLKAQDNKWVYDPDVLASDINMLQDDLMRAGLTREGLVESQVKLQQKKALAELQIRQQGRSVGRDDAMSGQGDTLFKVETPQSITGSPKPPSAAQLELDKITKELDDVTNQMYAFEKANNETFANRGMEELIKKQKIYGSASGVVSGQSGLVKLTWETFARPEAYQKTISEIINTYNSKGFAPDKLSRIINKMTPTERAGTREGSKLYAEAEDLIELSVESRRTVMSQGKEVLVSTGEEASKVQSKFPQGERIMTMYDEMMKDKWKAYAGGEGGLYRYDEASEKQIVARLFANIQEVVRTGRFKVQKLTKPAGFGQQARFGVGYDTIDLNQGDLRRFFDSSYYYKVEAPPSSASGGTVTKRGGTYNVWNKATNQYDTKLFNFGDDWASSTENTKENVDMFIEALSRLQAAQVKYVVETPITPGTLLKNIKTRSGGFEGWETQLSPGTNVAEYSKLLTYLDTSLRPAFADISQRVRPFRVSNTSKSLDDIIQDLPTTRMDNYGQDAPPFMMRLRKDEWVWVETKASESDAGKSMGEYVRRMVDSVTGKPDSDAFIRNYGVGYESSRLASDMSEIRVKPYMSPVRQSDDFKNLASDYKSLTDEMTDVESQLASMRGTEPMYNPATFSTSIPDLGALSKKLKKTARASEETNEQLQTAYASVSKFKQIRGQLGGYRDSTEALVLMTVDEKNYLRLGDRQAELVAFQDRLIDTSDATIPISKQANQRSLDESVSLRKGISDELKMTEAKIGSSVLEENKLKLQIKKLQDAMDRNIVNVDDLPVSSEKILSFDLFQLDPLTNVPGQIKGSGRELGSYVPEGVTDILKGGTGVRSNIKRMLGMGDSPLPSGGFGTITSLPGTTLTKGKRLLASATGSRPSSEEFSTFLFKNPNAYKIEEYQYLKSYYKQTENVQDWAPSVLEVPKLTGLRGKTLETFSDLFKSPDSVPEMMRGIPVQTFVSKLLTGTPKDKQYLKMVLRETFKWRQKPTDISFVADPNKVMVLKAKATEMMMFIAKRDDPLYSTKAEFGWGAKKYQGSQGENLPWLQRKYVQREINKMLEKAKELDPNDTFKFDVDKIKGTVDDKGDVVNIFDSSDILKELDSTKRVQTQIKSAMSNMFEPNQGFTGGTAGPNWRTGWKQRDRAKEAREAREAWEEATTKRSGDFSDPNAPKVTKEGLEEVLKDTTKEAENPYITKDPEAQAEATAQYFTDRKKYRKWEPLPYTGYLGDSYAGGFTDYGGRFAIQGGPAMAGSPAPTMPPLIPSAYGDVVTKPVQFTVPTTNLSTNLGQVPIGGVSAAHGLVSGQWQAGLQTSKLDFNFRTGNMLRELTSPALKQTQALRPMMAMKSLEAFAPVIKPKMRPKMGLPPVLIPPYLDPYNKRRKPKKKKAKKRKKKKIWWDVPDSPFKTFSAKEYKVFTGGEPSSVTRLERRRFPFENWGQY